MGRATLPAVGTLSPMDPITANSELTGRAVLTVTEADTAIALRSGDVPVLGTPRLIALLEEAAVAALAGALPDDLTSVGVNVSVDHLAPSPVGATVTATAVLEAIDDEALEFAVEAMDGDTMVAIGGHTRVVVERDRFLAGLA